MSKFTDMTFEEFEKFTNSWTQQVGGDHYKKVKTQPWEVMLDWGLDPWLCNVLKYVQRHSIKNGKEDLEKARHYIDFVIQNYDKVVDKYYKT